MSFETDAMQILSNSIRALNDKMYHLKKFNDNIGVLKDLNELLKRDIELREREYAVRIIELGKKGINEKEVEETVLRLKKKGL